MAKSLHSENPCVLTQASVHELLDKEAKFGMTNIVMYRGFQEKIEQLKRRITKFLIELKDQGKVIAAYDACLVHEFQYIHPRN
ncbi:hypothetical protein [Paenibacillus polymyxa]|uniref:hypothetical protein n=1 Tax=Paenibacillus polymyxa TaxID=1406 RepID=UPI0009B6E9D9